MALGLIFGGFGALGFFGVNTIANSSVQKADAGAKSAKAETTPVKEVEPVAVHESDKIENTIQSDTSIEAWDVTDVVEEVMPTVVSITNQSTQEATNFFGQTQEYESETSGSGIIVGQNDSELLVVTNNHVADDATTLSVQFIDRSSVNGKMKGGDSEVDLAIVAIPLADIDSDTMDEIKIATLGESEALEVGEPAIAIGNALGYGQSVTTGVISAINREITIDNHTSVLIQTDAAINPGNSGGALLNMKGEVIGINAAKFGSSMIEGMGYAIPISQAKPIINDLMNRETRDKVALGEESYLGISGVDVTEEVAQTYDMPIGVYVAQALEGTAAEEAGIQKGDIITKFDGQSITSMAELQETLTYYPA
ncbi:MAG: trypsin-like serine protease, partial [Clostridia bacterium]|nr:trypsin-like serine protease [Clostridia bacterium]